VSVVRGMAWVLVMVERIFRSALSRIVSGRSLSRAVVAASEEGF
jgi:hypothetical protein